jgi:hypothetical protein
MELNRIFYVHQKEKSSEALSRKCCSSDRAASTSPKGVKALHFAESAVISVVQVDMLEKFLMLIFEEDGPKDNLLQHGGNFLYFHTSVDLK